MRRAVATTTSPTKGNAGSLVFLKDATIVVQNAVAASAATASSPDPADDISPFAALRGAKFVAAGLKDNLIKFGLISER